MKNIIWDAVKLVQLNLIYLLALFWFLHYCNNILIPSHKMTINRGENIRPPSNVLRSTVILFIWMGKIDLFHLLC